jgi:hypothetical protein
MVTTIRGVALFEPNEVGHPLTYAGCLEEIRVKREGHGVSRSNHVLRSQKERSPQMTKELLSSTEVES